MKKLIFVFGIFMILSLLGSTARAQDPMATIRLINGSLKIQRAEDVDEGKWEIATIGMMVFPGDKLKTGNNSKAYILFTDATQIKMNSNSLLTIEGKREKRSLIKKLKLSIGEIWGKVTRQDSPMEIETPTSVASIKGTEFDLLVGEDGETYLFVFEGSIEFMNELGQMIVGTMMQAYSGEGEPPDTTEVEEIPDWQDEMEPQWNLIIQPEEESVKIVDVEFSVIVKATDMSTGELDEDYDKVVTISSNSSTMMFSSDGGEGWSNTLEFTLNNGQANLLVKDSQPGTHLMGAAAEETSPGFSSVVVAEEGEEQEIKTMEIEIERDGETNTFIIKYVKPETDE